MSIRAIDENGDWEYGKGLQDYFLDLDAIKMNIETKLRSWKGDCFFDLAAGVDYNNFLDIGTKVFLDRDVKRVILQSEGVIKINSFSSVLDRGTRDLTIEVEIDTIYGVLQQEVVV